MRTNIYILIEAIGRAFDQEGVYLDPEDLLGYIKKMIPGEKRSNTIYNIELKDLNCLKDPKIIKSAEKYILENQDFNEDEYDDSFELYIMLN